MSARTSIGEPLLVRANMFVMSMGPISEMDMVCYCALSTASMEAP